MSRGENEQNEFTFESQADLVIGIDFGTTFSGVAWAITANVINVTDKKKIVDKVKVIRQWPGDGQADKIPTLLAYPSPSAPPLWGFRVKRRDKPRVAHFKLGLQKDVKDVYARAPVPKISVLGGLSGRS